MRHDEYFDDPLESNLKIGDYVSFPHNGISDCGV